MEAFFHMREFENFLWLHLSWLSLWSTWNLSWYKVWGMDPTWCFNPGSTFHKMTGQGACMVCAHPFQESQPTPQGQTVIQMHHWVCLFFHSNLLTLNHFFIWKSQLQQTYLTKLCLSQPEGGDLQQGQGQEQGSQGFGKRDHFGWEEHFPPWVSRRGALYQPVEYSIHKLEVRLVVQGTPQPRRPLNKVTEDAALLMSWLPINQEQPLYLTLRLYSVSRGDEYGGQLYVSLLCTVEGEFQ